MAVDNQLHRIVYCSRQYAETRDLDAHIERILAVSRRNNARDGLTGLLLAHEGWFVQALEGPAWAVNAAYGRILFDRRHHAAQVLAAGPAPARVFGLWSMCARRLGAGDAALLRALGGSERLDPERLDSESALTLLQAVAELRTAAAA